MNALDELLTFEGKELCWNNILYILNDYVNCRDLITLLINYVVGGYSIKFSNRASVIKVGNVSLMVRGQVNWTFEYNVTQGFVLIHLLFLISIN